jgi:hypothetical protein
MNLRTVNAIAPAEHEARTLHDGHAATLQAFMQQRAPWLHGLGPLLCCARAGRRARDLHLSDSTLLVSACAEVRAAGPREWLSLETLHGEIQARLYLLPDTDFCQWDALCAMLPCRNATLLRQCALAGTAQVLHWTRAARRLRAMRSRQLSTPGQALALQLACEEACQLEPLIRACSQARRNACQGLGTA